MRVYEGIWGYIRVYEAHIGYFLQGGKIGCFASTIGNYWHFLATFVNYWQLLATIGNFWLLLAIIRNFGQYMSWDDMSRDKMSPDQLTMVMMRLTLVMMRLTMGMMTINQLAILT